MRTCDLCKSAPPEHVARVGDRSDRRVWLCAICFPRFDGQELDAGELHELLRRVAGRAGKCDWCESVPPVTQVGVRRMEGGELAFFLCAACARRAREEAAARLLHVGAALDQDVAIDPRYERARQIATRRRQIRRVK
jgi:hypothetical protein